MASSSSLWEDSRPFIVKDRRVPTTPKVQQQSIDKEEEDDDDDSLFDLTSADLARLQADLIRRGQDANAERTLSTKRMRETDQRKTILEQYKQVVLQIRFPDDHVLETEFKSSETSQDVYNFVRNQLSDPSVEFQIVTQALRAKPLELGFKDEKNQLWKQGFYVNTILRVVSKTPLALRSGVAIVEAPLHSVPTPLSPSSSSTTTATAASASASSSPLSSFCESTSPATSSPAPIQATPPQGQSTTKPTLTPEQREDLVLKKLGIARRHG